MSVSLITIDELAEELAHDPSALAVVDTRSPDDYNRGHVASAVRIGWEDWNERPVARVKEILTTPGYWGKLADPSQGRFAEKLSSLGLSSDKPIVVYADARISKGCDGRVAWMLAYLGAADVRLLNGSFSEWKKAGLPVETGESQRNSERGIFQVKIDSSRRCCSDELASLLQCQNGKPLILLDTRSGKEFSGDAYWYQPRKGRIPGARLLAFESIYKCCGRYFVSCEEYAKLLPENHAGAKIVAYCEVGVRASSVALLHEIHTGDVMPVYDGSIMEWGADQNLPIERDNKSPSASDCAEPFFSACQSVDTSAKGL